MQAAVTELAPVTGVADACRVLEVPRSTFYRVQEGETIATGASTSLPLDQSPPIGSAHAPAPARPRRSSPRALSAEERGRIRAVLNSERFVDCAPREVYATLLDEG